MGTYRKPESKKEVYSLFQRENFEGSFVWVVTAGIREIFPIEFMELTRQNETLYLKLSKKFNRDDLEFIYIYHPFRKTVSKAAYLAHHDDHMTVLLPENIKTLDTRAIPRFKFRPRDEKFVTLKFESSFMSSASQQLKFQIIDISQSGIAVCISHKNKDLLKNSSALHLTHLGKIPLPNPVKLDPVYLRDFTYKSKGRRISTNRAGFKFEGNLKKFVLTAFAEKY